MAQLLRGTITQEDREFTETWQNIAVHATGIIHLDHRGEEQHELIQGDREFFITTEERLISESRILLAENDPFKNGDFRPVVVPESVTTETNPNALSSDEIVRVLKSSEVAWTEWMRAVTSGSTLRRMLDMAEEVDISLARYREIEARLVEIHPQARITTSDAHLKRFLEDRANTGQDSPEGATNGKGNPRRHQGGRSSDYR